MAPYGSASISGVIRPAANRSTRCVSPIRSPRCPNPQRSFPTRIQGQNLLEYNAVGPSSRRALFSPVTTTHSAPVTDDALSARFQPVFDRIAAGAVEREKDRRLAHDEIALLRDAGFGALRVPVEFGGSGATVTQLFSLLVDLAAAESNLPQALRVHWSFVEDQVAAEAGPERDAWLRAGAADWATKDALGLVLALIGGGTLPTSAPERPAEPVAELGLWLRWLLRHERFEDVERWVEGAMRLPAGWWVPLRREWGIALAQEGFAGDSVLRDVATGNPDPDLIPDPSRALASMAGRPVLYGEPVIDPESLKHYLEKLDPQDFGRFSP